MLNIADKRLKSDEESEEQNKYLKQYNNVEEWDISFNYLNITEKTLWMSLYNEVI